VSSSSSISGYKEQTTTAEFFRESVVNNPKIRCHKSGVAEMCGLNMKLYYFKCKRGCAQYYREGGQDAAVAVMVNDPGFLRDNNGIASWLTIDPDIGLPEWTVTGKAYVVLEDGALPLSRGQVWGIQEMINCLMDIYDFDPDKLRLGRSTLGRWSQEYREKTWVPPSGLGGIDIYSYRSVAPDGATTPNSAAQGRIDS
jgi:hypothetical protein